MTIVRRILPVLLAAVLLSACGETKDVLPEIEQDVKQEVETVLEEVEPTPEPTQTPEEAKTMASTASNATKDAPQVTDPSTWNDAGKTIMEALEKQYAPYGMTLQAKEGTPYFLAVNRDANVVTVYTADEDGRYTVPFMAMVCSGGVDTPLGYYATPVDYDWRLLMGPSYGQYATRIFDSYLFHSVPYYSQHKDDIEYDEYNLLGTSASLGCIRLEVVDVKWIYDNCPLGTPVLIYADAENPGPMGKPGTIYTDPADTEKPTSRAEISARVNTPPLARNLTSLRPEAPAITGMARKKVNWEAAGRLIPQSRPPMMVEPLREVPGIRARTCQAPTMRACL